MTYNNSQIGLIGLGTMGANLARNIADKGFYISVNNRTKEKTEKFIKEYGNEFIHATFSVKEFLESLKSPRIILIMVKSGDPVDFVIEELLSGLQKGDVLIDCGNSHYKDTQKRFEKLAKKGIGFIGCGVSGGEEGALHGPSLMPGGTIKDYEKVEPIFKKIAAKDFSSKPCVTYLGENGAGHFVKTVHNGIEYAIMQLLAEAYDMLKNLFGKSAPEISEVFEKFNNGKLKSYLLEIGIDVLRQKDEFNKGYLVDYIADIASQKGTGTWTAIEALERGIPIPTITSAVLARYFSGMKTKRDELNKFSIRNTQNINVIYSTFEEYLEDALYCAILCSYIQGFILIEKTALEEKWEIDNSEVARIWQGGCIIRAEALKEFEKYLKKATMLGLCKHTDFTKIVFETSKSLRQVVRTAMKFAVPVPCFSSSLSFFDSMTSNFLPANFIQGLRDYFGAHTYQRTDREGVFHTDWKNNQNNDADKN